jgi:hypothetical protein
MSFYTDVILRSSKRDSAHRIDTVQLLESGTARKVAQLLARMAALGHPMLIWETYRSQTRQTSLYARGKSRARISTHTYGLAADIVFDIGGEPSWRGPWDAFGKEAKDAGLVWGGDWDGDPKTRHSFYDLNHVQNCPVEKQAELVRGIWYPKEGAK